MHNLHKLTKNYKFNEIQNLHNESHYIDVKKLVNNISFFCK